MDLSADAGVFEGGFSDPVFGSQAVFRGVMDALANPGRIVDLGQSALPPAPLSPAAGAVLATLADYNTPVWFEADAPNASAWLAFHTGAPVTDNPDEADFAVLAKNSAVAGWSRFATGTASYPDRSATLLLPVDDLRAGAALQLRGPGIESTITIAPSGLPDDFQAAMTANAKLFPLGFDLLLLCGSEVIGLPRTTRITEA